MINKGSNKFQMLFLYGALMTLLLIATVGSYLYVEKLNKYDQEYLDTVANIRAVTNSVAKRSVVAANGDKELSSLIAKRGRHLATFAGKFTLGNAVSGLPPFPGRVSELAQSISGKAEQIADALATIDYASIDDPNTAYNAADVVKKEGGELVKLLDKANEAVVSEDVRPYFLLGHKNHLITLILGLSAIYALNMIRVTRKKELMVQQAFEDNQTAIMNLLDDISSLADGDLSQEVRVSEDITGAIADSINYTVEELRSLVLTIHDSAEQVAHTTRKTELLTQSLSEINDKNEKSIAETNSGVSVVAAEVKRMSEHAEVASGMAQSSANMAHEGASVVKQSIESMSNVREKIQETSKRIKRLGESSQEIGDILEIIDDISEQTNLLALNAAMQAAMAGEAGRGFAVVADEVQRLAERSSQATHQIDGLIKTIQADASEAIQSMESSTSEVVFGADKVEAAGESLGQIEANSVMLAEKISQLSEQAKTQSERTNTISVAMETIHSSTTESAEETRETASLIGQLATLSVTLKESVSGFTLVSDESAEA